MGAPRVDAAETLPGVCVTQATVRAEKLAQNSWFAGSRTCAFLIARSPPGDSELLPAYFASDNHAAPRNHNDNDASSQADDTLELLARCALMLAIRSFMSICIDALCVIKSCSKASSDRDHHAWPRSAACQNLLMRCYGLLRQQGITVAAAASVVPRRRTAQMRAASKRKCSRRRTPGRSRSR